MTTATIEHLREAFTIEQLRATVTDIDSMSQTAFTEIATFAKLALDLLESPHSYQDPEILACVLESICGKAQDAENYINGMAEGVACNHKDQAMHRRFEAMRKARESASIGRA
jgi:hypothetical protein